MPLRDVESLEPTHHEDTEVVPRRGLAVWSPSDRKGAAEKRDRSYPKFLVQIKRFAMYQN